MESTTTRLRAKRPGGRCEQDDDDDDNDGARCWRTGGTHDCCTRLNSIVVTRRPAGGREGERTDGRRVYRVYTAAAAAAMEGMLFNRSYTASRAPRGRLPSAAAAAAAVWPAIIFVKRCILFCWLLWASTGSWSQCGKRFCHRLFFLLPKSSAAHALTKRLGGHRTKRRDLN